MLWRIDTSNPHPSFRRRLLLTYTLGVLGLALATSLATAWVANYRSGQLLMAQGIEITENLARQRARPALRQRRECSRRGA